MNQILTKPINRSQIILTSVTVGLAAICLVLSAQAEHVNTVAGLPIVLHGLSVGVPVGFLHYFLPLLLVINASLLLFLGPLPPWTAALVRVLCVVSLTTIWLQTLVRHELLTSLYQGALIVLPLLPKKLWKADLVHGLPAGTAMVLICVVVYGAVYGETRCTENSYVRCQITEGPPVWVPHILNSIGMSPFARLQNEDLEGVILAGANLRYADFSGANLKGATLAGANLRRARLDRIQADGSDWRSAYLDGASLSEAVLAKADLRRIHAYRVNLRRTNLTDADLRGANLSHAEMAEAVMAGVRLEDTYLRFTENLQDSQLTEACGNHTTRLPEGLMIGTCETPPQGKVD